jgi:hypothetical protein
MSAEEFEEFIERNGVQLWPQRKAKHGPIMQWWAQVSFPFEQTYGATPKEAVEKLYGALRRHF